MPSAVHRVLLALHAAAFIAFTSPSITMMRAVASPLPMPLPLLAPDYSHDNDMAAQAFRGRLKNKHNDTEIAHHSRLPRAVVTGSYPARLDNLLGLLGERYTQADLHSKKLSKY
jgi:hypothetical protein